MKLKRFFEKRHDGVWTGIALSLLLGCTIGCNAGSASASPETGASPDARPTAPGPGGTAAAQASPAASPGASPTASPAASPTTVAWEKPKHVRGIYLTAWSAGSSRKMDKVLAMMANTELNSVVIDVRDTGEMYWKTGIPLAEQAGANQIAVADGKKLFERLRKHNVWPIARIACFRDNFVPKKFPDRAVQLPNGKPWRDRSGHAWLDPYDKRNWEYIAQTVDYALDQGFPAIQLDYVRFPSEGSSSTQRFPNRTKYDDPNARQGDVIAAFAKYIGDRVRARGAEYSADNFGIISSSKKDQGIGQDLESLAEPFDVMSPMVYPSHFAKGEYGIADPDRAPYQIILKSMGDYKKRLPEKAMRPWLQDFSLGNKYGPAQVRAQIKAMYELGYREYLLWNASNRYTESAVKSTKDLLPKAAQAEYVP